MMASSTVGFMGVILVLSFVAIVMVLQVFMSKEEDRRIGFIMPIIMFCVSLVASFQIMMRLISSRSFTGIINGTVTEHTTSVPSIIGQTALIFVLCNIVTGILIAIYMMSKRKRNARRGLEMMSVQDLG